MHDTCLRFASCKSYCSVPAISSEDHGGYRFCSNWLPTQSLALMAQLADLLRVDVLLLEALQVEALAEVERAFVHVDYIRREELEHKVRCLSSNLVLGSCTCTNLRWL